MMLLGRPYTDENGHVDNELIDSLAENDKKAVLSWVRSCMKERKTYNKSHTSYGLKHLLEEDLGIYLTNNQFKDAMLECGFYPRDPDELNWVYKIDEQWLRKARLKRSS